MAQMNQSQYAKHLGVSRQAVFDAIKRGRITVKNGMCDPAVNDAEWMACAHPATSKVIRTNGGVKGLPAYSESKTARAAYEAGLARLDYEKEKGKLVESELTLATWLGIVATTKTRLLMVPDDLGERIAPETNPIRCREMIAAGIRAALEDLAATA